MPSTFEQYVTVDGDMVDLIAYNRFGTSDGQTEAILDANPGLAAAGEQLPAGMVVLIPVPQVQDRTTMPRLWD